MVCLCFHHHHQSLNCEGCWGTTDDFATSFLHFSVLHCPLGPAEFQACPFPYVVFPPLPLSALTFFPLSQCLAGWFRLDPMSGRHDHNHCSLCLFTIVRRSSSGPVACWILARTSSVLYLAVAPHFHGLYSSLELCCEGPWFTSIQEDGCDKGAH